VYGIPAVVIATLSATDHRSDFGIAHVLLWRNQYWTLIRRTHYSLVTLALAFIPFLLWNLLGFSLKLFSECKNSQRKMLLWEPRHGRINDKFPYQIYLVPSSAQLFSSRNLLFKHPPRLPDYSLTDGEPPCKLSLKILSLFPIYYFRNFDPPF